MFGKKKVERVYYKAIRGSSARAKYTNHAATVHRIEMTFHTESGEEVIIDMDHEVAAEVIEQGINAHHAIQRPIRIVRNLPFG